jgi:hypothetical protein
MMMDYKEMKKSEVVEAAKVFEGSLRRAESQIEAQAGALSVLRRSTEFAEEQVRNKGAKVQLGKNILSVMKDNHVALTLFGYTFIFMVIPKSLAAVARIFRTMDSLDECPRFTIDPDTGEAVKK